MVLVQKPIKSVYLWTNKVRPKQRTFTISRTEESDMSSWWTYSDDAAWLTAGSTAFDEFFWYSGVRLSTAWVETAEITQTASGWAWKLNITSLWTLTSGDNVMIKFPVRWIKMTKSWSTVTLSITDWLDRESEWYQYYAHCTWTLSSPWTPKDAFYLWAYEWSYYDARLKSWSWQSPRTNSTQSVFCTLAKNNGSWYNIIGFYQRQYINALYMMKYGNPNSQSVVWQWYVTWNSRPNTWWTNSQTNATYWTSSSTQQIKLFWLEDWWGNISEWVWWMYTDGSYQLCTMLTGRSWAVSWWTWTWTNITGSNELSSIAGNNKAMFAPTWVVSNSSYNTYYCDRVAIYTSCLAAVGGSSNYDNAEAGAFWLRANNRATTENVTIGSRLMYLNWLT